METDRLNVLCLSPKLQTEFWSVFIYIASFIFILKNSFQFWVVIYQLLFNFFNLAR